MASKTNEERTEEALKTKDANREDERKKKGTSKEKKKKKAKERGGGRKKEKKRKRQRIFRNSCITAKRAITCLCMR